MQPPGDYVPVTSLFTHLRALLTAHYAVADIDLEWAALSAAVRSE